MYDKHFNVRPRVRYVGLVSPVGQMRLPFTRTDIGWEKSLPQGVTYANQIGGNEPNHLIFPETDMDLNGATEWDKPIFPYNHASIGLASEALHMLVNGAAWAKAPVRAPAR